MTIENSEVVGFRIQKFNKLSPVMAVLVIISLLLSYFGLGFFFFVLAIPFLLAPKLYTERPIKKISIWMLKLSSQRLKIFQLIPFISLTGLWFIEANSEEIKFDGTVDLLKFIKSHWFEFFIIFPGMLAFSLRIAKFIEVEVLNITNTTQEYFVGLTLWGSGIAFLWLPIGLIFYFTWIWVWEDAELKILSLKKSSKGTSSIRKFEDKVSEMWPASTSVKKFIGLFAGFSAITWLAENFALEIAGSVSYTGFDFYGYLIGLIIALIVFITGPSIFMGVMYYRSGSHEILVNNLRNYINNEINTPKITKSEIKIKIGKCKFIPVNSIE